MSIPSTVSEAIQTLDQAHEDYLAKQASAHLATEKAAEAQAESKAQLTALDQAHEKLQTAIEHAEEAIKQAYTPAE